MLGHKHIGGAGLVPRGTQESDIVVHNVQDAGDVLQNIVLPHLIVITVVPATAWPFTAVVAAPTTIIPVIIAVIALLSAVLLIVAVAVLASIVVARVCSIASRVSRRIGRRRGVVSIAGITRPRGIALLSALLIALFALIHAGTIATCTTCRRPGFVANLFAVTCVAGLCGCVC